VAPPAPIVAPARDTVEAILKSMNGREGVVTARRATVSGLIIGVEGDLVTIDRLHERREDRDAAEVGHPRDPRARAAAADVLVARRRGARA
jgi:hypothetical protein